MLILNYGKMGDGMAKSKKIREVVPFVVFLNREDIEKLERVSDTLNIDPKEKYTPAKLGRECLLHGLGDYNS